MRRAKDDVLYKIGTTSPVRTAVGRTTVKNNVGNGAGNPATKRAVSKKVDPLTKVPIKPTNVAFIAEFAIFCKACKSKKRTRAVMTLSTRFATCPPGNVVVPAVKIPPNKPVVMQFLKPIEWCLIHY